MEEQKEYYTTDGRVHTWEEYAIDRQFELNTYYSKFKFPIEPAIYMIRSKKKFKKMIAYEMGPKSVKEYNADDYSYPDRFVCFYVENDALSDRGYEHKEKVYYAMTFDRFKEFVDRLFEHLE